MPRHQIFHNLLWKRDIKCLQQEERKLAQSILAHVRDCLGGIPYHRNSKENKESDRQTIIKHPETSKFFLAITVKPKSRGGPYQLQIDFTDKRDEISSEIFEVVRSPGVQWGKKSEKRFIIPPGTRIQTVMFLIDQICEENCR